MGGKAFSGRIKLGKLGAKRKYLIGFGSIVNVAVLAGVGFLVLLGLPGSSSDSSQLPASQSLFSGKQVTVPLDTLSSADIAVNLARMSNLDTAPAVAAQAEIQREQLEVPTTADNLAADKPQIVETELKSRHDIETYTVQEGDTVASIAKEFGITSNSLRWSNDLGLRNFLAAGKQLTIPPVEGIVYTVRSGDTPDSLASRYGVNKAKLIAFNDAEINGLPVGEKIVIPGGERRAFAGSRPIATSFGYGGSYSVTPRYGGNLYVAGTCTYYVANRIRVPNNWGNARSWAYNAGRTSGWTVNKTPRAGSIVQASGGSWFARGYGHVAVVDKVSADGKTMWISDMNWRGRWSRRSSVQYQVTGQFNFIHRN